METVMMIGVISYQKTQQYIVIESNPLLTTYYSLLATYYLLLPTPYSLNKKYLRSATTDTPQIKGFKNKN